MLFDEDVRVKINKIVKDSPFLLATATVWFDYVKTKGWRISKSKFPNRFGNYVWIQPPSSTSRIKTVVVDDLETWRRIEEKVLDAYEANKNT